MNEFCEFVLDAPDSHEVQSSAVAAERRLRREDLLPEPFGRRNLARRVAPQLRGGSFPQSTVFGKPLVCK